MDANEANEARVSKRGEVAELRIQKASPSP